MKYLHTMVRVTDIEDSLKFYCDGLGLQEVRRTDNVKGRYTLVFLRAPNAAAGEVDPVARPAIDAGMVPDEMAGEQVETFALSGLGALDLPDRPRPPPDLVGKLHGLRLTHRALEAGDRVELHPMGAVAGRAAGRQQDEAGQHDRDEDRQSRRAMGRASRHRPPRSS